MANLITFVIACHNPIINELPNPFTPKCLFTLEHSFFSVLLAEYKTSLPHWTMSPS